MTTTTIRLGNELNARVAAAAAPEGKTAHAFILDAIALTVEQAEMDEGFRRVSEDAGQRCCTPASQSLGTTPRRTSRREPSVLHPGLPEPGRGGRKAREISRGNFGGQLRTPDRQLQH
ncbi:MAG: hypothetical protein ABI699_11590 [Caldimonas sp.]